MGRLFYNNFKKWRTEVSFYFHLQLRKTAFEQLLSYEVTHVIKSKKQFQSKLKKKVSN